jgi:hypothetical protein
MASMVLMQPFSTNSSKRAGIAVISRFRRYDLKAKIAIEAIKEKQTLCMKWRENVQLLLEIK